MASQYDVGEDEQRAAAERLGIYRMTLAERHERHRLRKRGIIKPYPWLAADLAANGVRDEETGCLIWQRAGHSRGYGKIKRAGKLHYVHRLALEDKLGRPLLPGMYARHICDVRRCFEPNHLVEGTAHQNTRDMIERGRAAWQRREA